jgi:hypothetical protein
MALRMSTGWSANGTSFYWSRRQDYFSPFALRDSVEISRRKRRKDFPKTVGILSFAKNQNGSGIEPYKM